MQIATSAYVAVKAANTAPVGGDPALVVALSPNARGVTVEDVFGALTYAIEGLTNPIWQDPATGRLRVTVDNLAAAQTLATVTTVTTVTTVSALTNAQSLGGINANGMVFDGMQTAWALNVRARIG